MKIPVMIYQDENWTYIAESPILEGFHTYWENREDLFKNLEELEKLFEDMIKNNEVKPPKFNYMMDYFLELNISDNVGVSN